MAHNEHHEHLIREVSEMLAPVFEKSPQAVYLYLDDEHKNCNQKFADLVGYASIEEWVENPAPLSDVVDMDQDKVAEAYGKASESMEASTLSVNINKKDGSSVGVDIIMVPLSYKEEVFVLHFISQK